MSWKDAALGAHDAAVAAANAAKEAAFVSKRAANTAIFRRLLDNIPVPYDPARILFPHDTDDDSPQVRVDDVVFYLEREYSDGRHNPVLKVQPACSVDGCDTRGHDYIAAAPWNPDQTNGTNRRMDEVYPYGVYTYFYSHYAEKAESLARLGSALKAPMFKKRDNWFCSEHSKEIMAFTRPLPPGVVPTAGYKKIPKQAKT